MTMKTIERSNNVLPRQHGSLNGSVMKKAQTTEKELKAILRNISLKVTDQRLLILKELFGSSEPHVTAQQLFESVNERDSSIGFATVYRLLRSLTDAGLMTETRMGGVSARYELSSKKHHDHLTCQKCGDICEFENDEIEKLQYRVAEKFGYKLTHHVLELFGVCPSCQRQSIQDNLKK